MKEKLFLSVVADIFLIHDRRSMIYQADFVTNIYNFSYLRFLIAQIWAAPCYLHIKDCDSTAHVLIDNCILMHVDDFDFGFADILYFEV